MNSLQLRNCLLTIGSQDSSPSQKKLAWDQLYWDPGFRSWLYEMAYSFSQGNFHMTEDLQQEGWEVLQRAAPSYRAEMEPFSWRKAVILNRFRNIIQRDEEKWQRLSPYKPGTGIEDVLGDDPQLPPANSD